MAFDFQLHHLIAGDGRYASRIGVDVYSAHCVPGLGLLLSIKTNFLNVTNLTAICARLPIRRTLLPWVAAFSPTENALLIADRLVPWVAAW